MDHNWELKKAVTTVIKSIVQLKEGEDVLIYADTVADAKVVESIAAAAHITGGTEPVASCNRLKQDHQSHCGDLLGAGDRPQCPDSALMGGQITQRGQPQDGSPLDVH